MLQVHLRRQVTPQAFAAGVHAELIRLGVTAGAAPQLLRKRADSIPVPVPFVALFDPLTFVL